LTGYTSDKGLRTRIYKELKKLKFPQINEPKKKWTTDINRTFSRKKSKWLPPKKTVKKCSPSLVIKEMQIKTKLRFHLTPVTITITKTPATANVGKDVRK
jgi:hypothetical protein